MPTIRRQLNLDPGGSVSFRLPMLTDAMAAALTLTGFEMRFAG